MKLTNLSILLVCLLCIAPSTAQEPLVDLKELSDGFVYEIRYATDENFMSERLALKFFNVSRLVSDNLLFVMMKFLSSSKSVICFSSTFVIVFLSRSI